MSEDPCQCSPACDDAFPSDLIGWGGCMESCQARCSGTPRWNLNLGYAEYFPTTKHSISAGRKLSLVIFITGLLVIFIFIWKKR